MKYQQRSGFTINYICSLFRGIIVLLFLNSLHSWRGLHGSFLKIMCSPKRSRLVHSSSNLCHFTSEMVCHHFLHVGVYYFWENNLQSDYTHWSRQLFSQFLSCMLTIIFLNCFYLRKYICTLVALLHCYWTTMTIHSLHLVNITFKIL